MFGCYFYTFGYTKHFDTLDEAIECGKKSGFGFIVLDGNGEVVVNV